MTWVLGSAVRSWGYAAIIGDVRVSWGNLVHHDVLQKIFPVAPHLAAGFAGSVELGYWAIADMTRYFNGDGARHAFSAERAAQKWRARIRQKFAQSDAVNVQSLGCQIVIVGLTPRPGAPSGVVPSALKMVAPFFKPQSASPFGWVSIGDGVTSEVARSYADQDMQEFANGVGRGDVAMGRGGTAELVVFGIQRELRVRPIGSVTDKLQLGLVFDDGFELRYPYWHAPENPIPQVEKIISNYEEFREFAHSKGLPAASASG